MVRIIAGTLIRVGGGEMLPDKRRHLERLEIYKRNKKIKFLK